MSISRQSAFDMETSQHSTYRDFEWAVKLNRFSLNVVGLWPKSMRNTREKLLCNLRALFVFLTIVLVILIPSLHSLIRIYGDIMLTIDNLQYTLPIIICLLKLMIFWRRKKALIPLVGMMAKDWANRISHRDTNIMIMRAQTARVIITVGYVAMLLSLAAIVIMTVYGTSMRYVTNITDPGRLLPFQTYYVYDVTKSPQYELTCISQTISMFFCAMLYTGVDNFLSLVIFHISGQLDILIHRLDNLDKFANFTSVLNSCVIEHTRLLKAIAIIEDTFNVLLLVLFLYFGAVFAFYGYYVITMLEEGNSLFSILAYLVGIVMNMFGHMCLYCALGEILTAQCGRIHYAVYCNKWYAVDERHIKDIIFLMLRTNKPLYLTAGKLLPLTMATFCNLTKTSAGYISILVATRN